MQFPCFPVLQGSAESLIRQGGKLYRLLSTEHSCQKLLKSINIVSSYSQKCLGSFLRHTVHPFRQSLSDKFDEIHYYSLANWRHTYQQATLPVGKMPSSVLVSVSIGSVGLGLVGPFVSVRVSVGFIGVRVTFRPRVCVCA